MFVDLTATLVQYFINQKHWDQTQGCLLYCTLTVNINTAKINKQLKKLKGLVHPQNDYTHTLDTHIPTTKKYIYIYIYINKSHFGGEILQLIHCLINIQKTSQIAGEIDELFANATGSSVHDACDMPDQLTCSF